MPTFAVNEYKKYCRDRDQRGKVASILHPRVNGQWITYIVAKCFRQLSLIIHPKLTTKTYVWWLDSSKNVSDCIKIDTYYLKARHQFNVENKEHPAWVIKISYIEKLSNYQREESRWKIRTQLSDHLGNWLMVLTNDH